MAPSLSLPTAATTASWCSISCPNGNNVAAETVLGQLDAVSNAADPPTTVRSFNLPTGVAIYNSSCVLVADSGMGRVSTLKGLWAQLGRHDIEGVSGAS